MRLRELIENAVREDFVEDGSPCRLTLVPPGEGLNEAHFREQFKGTIPPDYADLLQLASGFSIGSTEVTFTEYHFMGFDFLFEDWMEIMADGFGNHWCLEMFPGKPDWGPVWFVCHDPPAIVRIADDMSAFLELVLDAHRAGHGPNAWCRSWELADSVCGTPIRMTRAGDMVRSADAPLRELASSVEPDCEIVDLRERPAGFPWAEFDHYHEIVRMGDPMLFAMRRE